MEQIIKTDVKIIVRFELSGVYLVLFVDVNHLKSREILPFLSIGQGFKFDLQFSEDKTRINDVFFIGGADFIDELFCDLPIGDSLGRIPFLFEQIQPDAGINIVEDHSRTD